MCILIENRADVIRPTPLLGLLSHIEHSAFALAPERAIELAQIVQKHDLFLRIDPYQSSFSVAVTYGRIILPLRALEHIWAYAYGYSVLHDANQPTEPFQRVYASAHPEFRFADHLIRWSQAGERSKELIEWPVNHPRPDILQDPRVLIANSIFLTIVGFILLHEIAHLELAHDTQGTSSPEDLIASELEADDWAVSWVLSQWRRFIPNPDVFIQRTTGIAFGLATIDAVETLFHLTEKSKSHPNLGERQLRFLDGWVGSVWLTVGPVLDNAWRAAGSALSYHLHLLGQSDLVDQRYEHTRDFVVAARDRFRQLQK